MHKQESRVKALSILFNLDYAAIEKRVLAGKDFDLHKLTAAERLGIKPEDVTPEQRREQKALNFVRLYR